MKISRLKNNCKIQDNKNNLFAGSTNVLRNIPAEAPEASEDIDNIEKGDEVLTTKELARLVAWLKKEGYTLEDIETLLKYIAGLIEIDFD